MKPWPLIAVAIYAFGMALFFAQAGSLSPESGRAAIPAALAFTAVGMLAGVTIRAFMTQEERIRRLETRLNQLQPTPSERQPTADPADQ